MKGESRKKGVVGCVRRGIRGDHDKYTDQRVGLMSGQWEEYMP